MKLSFSIEGRCLRHGVGTPTIKRRVGERESMCYGTLLHWGGRAKGGGGGGFSGDHLPVSGACSCRARFFFSLSSSLMLACVSMWHRRKEIVKWQQLFNDFRRQFFLFFLQSACQTFARKNREDFVSNLGFFKNVLFHSQTLFFFFSKWKKRWPWLTLLRLRGLFFGFNIPFFFFSMCQCDD